MKIEDLGLSQKQLQDLIVDQAVNQLLYQKTFDEDGNDDEISSQMARQIEKMIKERIDQKITAVGEKHVVPVIGDAVENMVLQQTNEWGEKRGEPVTFTEYLIQRADHYMQEPVNFKGKTKKEDSYSWKANTTRIAYLINEHLQYAISTAMKKALEEANSSIVGGLEKAIRIQLADIHKKLKVSVKV